LEAKVKVLISFLSYYKNNRLLFDLLFVRKFLKEGEADGF